MNNIADDSNVHIVNMSDMFSINNIYIPVIDNILVYRNTGHITNTYAMFIMPILKNRLALKQYLNI